MLSFNTYWVAKQERRQLATAIMQQRTGGHQAQNRILTLLQKVNLLLPVAKLPPTCEIGDLVNHKNLPLQMSLAKTSTGKPYLALYTSEQPLRRHHPEPYPYVMVPFTLLANVALKLNMTGIIIDRQSPTWTILPASILHSLVSERFVREQNKSLTQLLF